MTAPDPSSAGTHPASQHPQHQQPLPAGPKTTPTGAITNTTTATTTSTAVAVPAAGAATVGLAAAGITSGSGSTPNTPPVQPAAAFPASANSAPSQATSITATSATDTTASHPASSSAAAPTAPGADVARITSASPGQDQTSQQQQLAASFGTSSANANANNPTDNVHSTSHTNLNAVAADAQVGAVAGAEAAPVLDAALRQLLDQQADIQARIDTLVAAQHHELDPALELQMLRHKCRVLEDVVVQKNNHPRHQGLISRIPVLSEVEEARALQYRCECLEAACLNDRIEFIEPLKLSSSTADTPPGFIPWLDRHLEQHDPVVRNGSHYTVTVAAARLQSDLAANELHDKSRVTNAAASSQSPLRALTPSLSSSFKCSDDRCVHFVYGFTNEADQTNHVHSHATATRFSKRDSGFSMGTATSSSPSTQRLPPAQPVLPDPLNHQGLHGYRRPSVGSSLTPLYTPSRDRGDGSITRSFPSTRPHTRGGSLESEVDPLLPPLKRNRVGHSRLQSIGELQLLRDNDPCLRCKLSHKACDSNQPCHCCLEHPALAAEDHWRVLGCFRGSISSFVDILLPRSVSPRQTQAPVTSPLSYRPAVNNFIQEAYIFPEDTLRTVEDVLDFKDDFWWSGKLDPSQDASITYLDSTRAAPPILCALASSWNSQDTSYGLLELLNLTGYLSTSRVAEEAVYPVLCRAKLLLREVAFYDIMKPDPAIHIDSMHPRAKRPDETDHEEHLRLIHDCITAQN
ncbi:hypothetical protein N3K66_005430 [Trichothecium roseum]|uniref:Uncharacterized protein n=1 Tax=Trichothecium roseum TaxID=47278 RepID=A0ACC0UZ48_9HYPO|nr:hypothetical protein N3K66_005430 [Trichothecium roseum]